MATTTNPTKSTGKPAKKQATSNVEAATKRSVKAGSTAEPSETVEPVKVPSRRPAKSVAKTTVATKPEGGDVAPKKATRATATAEKASAAKAPARKAQAAQTPAVKKTAANKELSGNGTKKGDDHVSVSGKTSHSRKEAQAPEKAEASEEETHPHTEKAHAPAEKAKAPAPASKAPAPASKAHAPASKAHAHAPAEKAKARTHAPLAEEKSEPKSLEPSEKAAAPKAATGLLSSRRRDHGARRTEGYTDERFLTHQHRALDTERATYMEQARSLKAEAESLVEEMEPGDIQFDDESGEGGTVTVDRERDLALSAQALVAVDEIDHALAKVGLGTYGICENCGRLIPKPRLEALPFARLCIDCKSGGLSRR